MTFLFMAGFVLFLCLSKEKERKRKDTKIKDQDTLMSHKPALQKMFCNRIIESIRLKNEHFKMPSNALPILLHADFGKTHPQLCMIF